MPPEFFVYLPQMRLTPDQLVERSRAAEAAGFAGIAGMDHLVPPQAEDKPMYEAMVANTWIAAHTQHLRIGSLVLCDSFRHPATLAREAVSLDHCSQGRFELGIGWGSVVREMGMFDAGSLEARERLGRFRETLEILKGLWAGETLDYDGEHFTMRGARQEPLPLGHIPIVIGGVGKTTMELVAAHADWWNIHTGVLGSLDRLEELRASAGNARASLQLSVALVTSEDEREHVNELAQRRFNQRAVVGNATELVDRFGALEARGIERMYVWFCDFAAPDTLAAFGEDVIAPMAASSGGLR